MPNPGFLEIDRRDWTSPKRALVFAALRHLGRLGRRPTAAAVARLTGLSARSVRDSGLMQKPCPPLDGSTEHVRITLPLAARPSRELKPAAKLLLVVLHDRTTYFHQHGGECFFAVGTLAEMFGVTPRGLQKSLAALRRLSLVEVQERPGRTSLYRTTERARDWMLGLEILTVSVSGDAGEKRKTVHPSSVDPKAHRKIVHPSADDGPKRKIVHPPPGKPFTPTPANSGKPFTQNRVLNRNFEPSSPAPELLPTSLLDQLSEGMELNDSVLRAFAELDWPTRCAVAERLSRFSEPIRHPLRAIARTVEKVEALVAEGGELALQHDPPSYDPWRHGPPVEGRHQALWKLFQRFPEAPGLQVAQRLHEEEARRADLIERLRAEERLATRSSMDQDACRQRWGYIPSVRLEELGEMPAASSVEAAEALLAQLRGAKYPTPAIGPASQGDRGPAAGTEARSEPLPSRPVEESSRLAPLPDPAPAAARNTSSAGHRADAAEAPLVGRDDPWLGESASLAPPVKPLGLVKIRPCRSEEDAEGVVGAR